MLLFYYEAPMFDFEEKKVIKNIIYSKVSLLILFVLLILVAKGAWNAYGDARVTKENKTLAEQQLLELGERGDSILAEIEQLNTQEGKEKEIRSKFSVIKDGEKMIMVVDSKDSLVDYSKEKNSVWERFLRLFE